MFKTSLYVQTKFKDSYKLIVVVFGGNACIPCSQEYSFFLIRDQPIQLRIEHLYWAALQKLVSVCLYYTINV